MALQNKSEHTSCLFYATEQTALFRQIRIKDGERLHTGTNEEGIILYTLKGDIIITLDGHPIGEVTTNNIVFLPKDSRLEMRGASDADAISCSLSMHIPLCSKYTFSDLLHDYESGKYNRKSPPHQQFSSHFFHQSLTANKRVTTFFQNLDEVLSDGLNGVPYHVMKRQELLLLLRAYYSKEDLFTLFQTTLIRNNKFKKFILQNYMKVADVNEFASLANMSVRSFQRKFRAEFDCSLRDWFLARKSELVLRELRLSDKSLFDIAMEFGFSGMSYFTTFCKNNLGMTPSQLRGQKKDGQEDNETALSRPDYCEELRKATDPSPKTYDWKY